MRGGHSVIPPAAASSCSWRNVRRRSSSSRRRFRSADRLSPSTSRSSKKPAWLRNTPEGTRRIYHLNEAGLSALRDQLDTFWNRALANYQDVIDHSTKEKS